MRRTQVNRKKAHFIGIGGIGISALARYFLSQGWQVSGSDSSPSPLLKELKAEGVKIYIDHRKSNLKPNVDLVIYSPAILSSNPELKEARGLGINSFTWKQVLGKLSQQYTTVAIAGTHGKSTATALTALAFIEAGMDPTVIVGTKVPQLEGKNFRLGKSKYLVIEADEYKDAFLDYSPSAILITNIDREHLDYFKDLNHIKRSFLKFVSNLWLSDSHSEVLVLNRDNAPLFSLKNHPSLRLRRSKIIWYSLRERELAQKIKNRLKIPGEHNLSNALGVYKLARTLGVKEKDVLRAFSKYHGSWRRMEFRGKWQMASGKWQVSVYDDYAHHPTEIKATLSAFREKFSKARIICVFQPHQADRLKKLFKEFVGAFDGADTLILLDIFKVRGREKNESRSMKHEASSKKLADAIRNRKTGSKVIYLPNSRLLRNSIVRDLYMLRDSKYKIPRPQAVVVMMGAGDIVELTPKLLDIRYQKIDNRKRKS